MSTELTLAFADDQPPPDPAAGRQVSVWRDDTGAVCATTHSAPGLQWIDWPVFGLFAFRPGSREVRVWRAPAASEAEVRAVFDRVLQPVILQALGWQALHASAVLGTRAALALCGHSHSGKSTLAYALRELGFAQLADDGLVIGIEGERVIAYALPFAPRLRPQSFARFARALHLPPDSPATAPPPISAPLAGVILLEQDAARTEPPEARRVPPAQAFTGLLTHAHCFDAEDPEHVPGLVDDYLSIAARVPVFSVRYAPGLERLSELLAAVRRIADECGAGAPPTAEAP